MLTDAELTEVRHSGRGVLPLRVLKAIYYGTVINCVVLAMVMVAAIRIAEVFLPWHDWLPAGLYQAIVGFVSASGLQLGESVTGRAPEVATANNLISILLILIFTAAYSTTGGLRSVINTDVCSLPGSRSWPRRRSSGCLRPAGQARSGGSLEQARRNPALRLDTRPCRPAI